MCGKNLSLFSTYLGANMAPSLALPWMRPTSFDAVDDLEVAVRIQKPASLGGTSRRSAPRPWRRVLCTLEQPGGLHHDFAVVGHLDLHATDRHAHGVGAGLVVGCRHTNTAVSGRTVQLLRLMPMER